MSSPSTWSLGKQAEWREDCLLWRKRVLAGEYSHWCFDYDGLPVDETCDNEWPCACWRASDGQR